MLTSSSEEIPLFALYKTPSHLTADVFYGQPLINRKKLTFQLFYGI